MRKKLTRKKEKKKPQARKIHEQSGDPRSVRCMGVWCLFSVEFEK